MPPQAPRIGLDAVSLARMRAALEGKEERWRGRVFTEPEWRSARASKDPPAALALCFAVKEAAMKALGSGWADGVAWQDLEVHVHPQQDPTLCLAGRAAEIAADIGLTLTASTAHTDELAVALVVGQ